MLRYVYLVKSHKNSNLEIATDAFPWGRAEDSVEGA
jgi:hypothetical protein